MPERKHESTNDTARANIVVPPALPVRINPSGGPYNPRWSQHEPVNARLMALRALRSRHVPANAQLTAPRTVSTLTSPPGRPSTLSIHDSGQTSLQVPAQHTQEHGGACHGHDQAKEDRASNLLSTRAHHDTPGADHGPICQSGAQVSAQRAKRSLPCPPSGQTSPDLTTPRPKEYQGGQTSLPSKPLIELTWTN